MSKTVMDDSSLETRKGQDTKDELQTGVINLLSNTAIWKHVFKLNWLLIFFLIRCLKLYFLFSLSLSFLTLHFSNPFLQSGFLFTSPSHYTVSVTLLVPVNSLNSFSFLFSFCAIWVAPWIQPALSLVCQSHLDHNRKYWFRSYKVISSALVVNLTSVSKHKALSESVRADSLKAPWWLVLIVFSIFSDKLFHL